MDSQDEDQLVNISNTSTEKLKIMPIVLEQSHTQKKEEDISKRK